VRGAGWPDAWREICDRQPNETRRLSGLQIGSIVSQFDTFISVFELIFAQNTDSLLLIWKHVLFAEERPFTRTQANGAQKRLEKGQKDKLNRP
jgi:hypothetical protein